MLTLLGCDVSSGRTSESAFVTILYEPGATPEQDDIDIAAIEEESLPSLPDVVDKIAAIHDAGFRGLPYDGVAVDAIGFGKGAVDYLLLKDFSSKVHAFIANEKASRDWEDEETQKLVEKRYTNLKTRVIMQTRQLAYRGRVRITAPNHDRLVSELKQYVLKKVGGRWKSEDPKRSPDVGDAMLVACSMTGDLHESFYFEGG